MDRILAKAIVDLKIPHFGDSLKNKGDSCSCLFRPRRLLSDIKIFKHCSRKIAQIVLKECSSKTLMGLATSGIAFAAGAAIYSNLPMMYIRKNLELYMSNNMIEGIPPQNKKIVLIDDLLFAGESKIKALKILKKEGYKVTDIIVVIDRQLQRKKEGLSIQKKWNLKLHSLIKMSEIIQYMKITNTITDKQLIKLIEDYQRFERWDMPNFAK